MNIIIASSHDRNSNVEENLKKKLPHLNVVFLTTPQELISFDFDSFPPDWIFFPHWSWIIRQHIYDNYRCVIFHMTDVPYGRGGSPLQNLIVRGHKETMLSAIKCVAELDAGPVYCKVPLSLEGTAETKFATS